MGTAIRMGDDVAWLLLLLSCCPTVPRLVLVRQIGRDNRAILGSRQIAAIAKAQKQLQLFQFQFWQGQWWPLQGVGSAR
jgi:hypothetical protein